jgi:hypothetical protein
MQTGCLCVCVCCVCRVCDIPPATLPLSLQCCPHSSHCHPYTRVTQQDPWIQNASLRANVLMGHAYDADRYNAVITACCLDRDLQVCGSVCEACACASGGHGGC